MLATLGFTTTGILFIIFASTLKPLAKRKLANIIDGYTTAYLLLAVAFIMWGAVSVSGSDRLLAASVVVGDVLILAATLLMLNILLIANKYRKILLAVAGALGVSLLLVRTIGFYPKPFMDDGVLFFNSQRLVSFTLTAVFLLVWLPVNLYISEVVTVHTRSMSRLYSLMYASASISATIFVLAKAPLTVVLSFTAVAVSFLMLILSNIYIQAIEEVRKNGK